MAPPSPLTVATSSVQRLVKEEAYYHKELVSQQTRVDKLEKDIKEGSKDLDENAEYILKQEVPYKSHTFIRIFIPPSILTILRRSEPWTRLGTFLAPSASASPMPS